MEVLVVMIVLGNRELSNNNFTGDLPTSFQDLKNLTPLKMDELNLSGRPRDQLFSQIHLTGQLDLSFNDFSGDIPYSSMSMKYLRYLQINGLAKRSGRLRDQLLHVKQLDLPFNDISGDIPYSLTSMKYLCDLNLSHGSQSGTGPVGNVSIISFFAVRDSSCQINGLAKRSGRLRDQLLHVKQLASKSTASSMHVHPLFLVLCFLLCFLLLKQQPQPQPQEQKLPEQLVLCFLLCFLLLKQPQPQPPPEEKVVEQKLPAQLSQVLDQDEDTDGSEDEDTDGSEDEDTDGSENLEEEDQHFYPDGVEDHFSQKKDPRAVWKRQRGGRHHWKKKFNYHH